MKTRFFDRLLKFYRFEQQSRTPKIRENSGAKKILVHGFGSKNTFNGISKLPSTI